VKLLFDTPVLLRWLFDDPAFSLAARAAISARANAVFVSSASAWEISTKRRLGRRSEAGAAIRSAGC
jgi:PIN domain nuclease of toxin-antitoxin system